MLTVWSFEFYTVHRDKCNNVRETRRHDGRSRKLASRISEARMDPLVIINLN